MVQIADSARKHGIADADIRHAVQIPFRTVRQGDSHLLIIGSSRTGLLLEVVVIDPDSDDRAVIHAMPLRRKFYDYL